MMPVVCRRMPGSRLRSSTHTRSPARRAASAQTAPAKLAPTTTTSHWFVPLDRSSMRPACRWDGCAAWGAGEAGAKWRRRVSGRARARLTPHSPPLAHDGRHSLPEDSAMTQFAEHVYTEQRDIARIESWAEQLEDEARVEIRLADGAR